MRPETLQSIRDFETRRNEASEEDWSPFQPGVHICVAAGPLAGMEGLVSNVSQERVVVLMQFLGRETRVNLNHHQLQLVR
jgi:transcription antitermination factor NusG